MKQNHVTMTTPPAGVWEEKRKKREKKKRKRRKKTEQTVQKRKVSRHFLFPTQKGKQRTQGKKEKSQRRISWRMKPTVAGARGGGGRGAAAAAGEKKRKRIFDLRSGRMNSPPLLWLLKKILKSSLEEAAGEGRREVLMADSNEFVESKEQKWEKFRILEDWGRLTLFEKMKNEKEKEKK